MTTKAEMDAEDRQKKSDYNVGLSTIINGVLVAVVIALGTLIYDLKIVRVPQAMCLGYVK